MILNRVVSFTVTEDEQPRTYRMSITKDAEWFVWSRTMVSGDEWGLRLDSGDVNAYCHVVWMALWTHHRDEFPTIEEAAAFIDRHGWSPAFLDAWRDLFTIVH